MSGAKFAWEENRYKKSATVSQFAQNRPGRRATMREKKRAVGGATVFITLLLSLPVTSWTADTASHESLSEIKKEIRQLESDRARDLMLMEKLEKRVDELESQNTQLKAANAQISSGAKQT